jgi:hypothetical protein
VKKAKAIKKSGGRSFTAAVSKKSLGPEANTPSRLGTNVAQLTVADELA